VDRSETDYSQGRGVNYYPASGLAPIAAGTIQANLEITVHPTSRLRIDETHFYTRLAADGASVFTNHPLRSR
jgi:hypothetical protein